MDAGQNYTLRLVAERGAEQTAGWLALDDIQMKRTDECMTLPPGAAPTSPAPTQSSTVPPQDDVFCTFQHDTCNFTIEAEGNENFKELRKYCTDLHFINIFISLTQFCLQYCYGAVCPYERVRG